MATLGQTFCLQSTLESTELPAEEEEKRKGEERRGEGRGEREERSEGGRERGREERGREGEREGIQCDDQYEMLTIQQTYLYSICFVNGVHSLNHSTPALIGGEINQSQHSSGNHIKMKGRKKGRR